MYPSLLVEQLCGKMWYPRIDPFQVTESQWNWNRNVIVVCIQWESTEFHRLKTAAEIHPQVLVESEIQFSPGTQVCHS